MSVLSSIRNSVAGAGAAVAGAVVEKSIEALHLDRAKALYNVEQLDRALSQVALDNDLESEVVQKAQADLATAQQRVGLLDKAIAAATIRDSERSAAAKASIRAAQTRAVQAHLRTRADAAIEITQAIETIGAAWSELKEASNKALAAMPGDFGPRQTMGHLFTFTELNAVIGNTIHRYAGSTHASGQGAFPGASQTGLEAKIWQDRDKIPTLGDRIAESNANLLYALTGKRADGE